MDRLDVCIAGAGVIGLAVARQLALSGARGEILLLEQQDGPGQGTSSRNSEVIHAGIYSPPDSLKTQLCLRGRELLYDFCSRFDVPHRRTGKLIVAGEDEQQRLADLMARAEANGVSLELLDRGQIARLEPEVSASAGLLSPNTGIVDSHVLMSRLLQQAVTSGVSFVPRTRVLGVTPVSDGFQVETQSSGEAYQFHCRQFINAAGLHAQELAARIEGLDQGLVPKLYPCKGSYFSYRGVSPFSRLVYPLPARHGLGIHATLDMGGQLRFGPDAEYVDEAEIGNLVVRPEKTADFTRAIMAYFPGLDASRLSPDYAGMRPKLQAPGAEFADFVIQGSASHGLPGLVQLFGIESPGLTAALAIAERVEALLAAAD